MTNTKKIKLTKSMKAVIIAMREREKVFKLVEMPVCKFSFMGKTFRYDLGTKLAYSSGLMKREDRNTDYYTLTELGRTIEI